jgi:outer membrane protein insertion porin family
MQVCCNRSFWRAAALAAALCVAPALTAPAAAQTPTGVAVGAVEVAGNRRVPAEQILATVNMEQGDTVMAAQLDEAIRRLLATGQFRDVQVFAVSNPANPGAPVTLRFQVEEQPIVAQIQFRGLENVSGALIRDTVGLRAGRPYEPARATRAETMARQLLAEKGFRVRSIEHRLEPLTTGGDEFSLVFDVAEGQRVAIADIEFVGNEAFSDSRLREEMNTKREGFWWFRPGTFDDDQLREDMRGSLPAFYAANGYIDAAIVDDSLAVDDQTGKARLIVRVEEGPQYRLAEFDVIGASRFASDDLRRYFEQRRSGFLSGFGLGTSRDEGTRTGEIFDQAAFEAATDDVRRLYTNQGYLYARINPVIERLPADSAGLPRVRVAWEIMEGNPASIRRVIIAGNTKTHEDVIRNQLSVLPGDIYSEEMLIQSYRRASGLGFFETPMPTPEMSEVGNCVENPSEPCQIDVIFNVTEKQTGSINFGTSLGGSLGLMGFLGYDQPNLFGQAKSGHLRWEFGRYSNNFEASYSDPTIRDTFLSGGISLFSSTDRFFTFSQGRRHRTGASLRLGIPMPTDRFSRLSVGYALSRTSYENFEEDQENIFSLPPGVQSTVTLSLDRMALDHPMFPTVGSRQSVEAALSGGIFGGDGDFQKYSVTGAWYVPVGSLGGGRAGRAADPLHARVCRRRPGRSSATRAGSRSTGSGWAACSSAARCAGTTKRRSPRRGISPATLRVWRWTSASAMRT